MCEAHCDSVFMGNDSEADYTPDTISSEHENHRGNRRQGRPPVTKLFTAVMLFLGISTTTLAFQGSQHPTQAQLIGIYANEQKNAEQGDAESQYFIGSQYYRGQGRAKDYVVAGMWLNLANARATGELAEDVTKLRKELFSVMTQKQLIDARQLAINWQLERTPSMQTLSMEDLIDAGAKVDACVESGYINENTVRNTIYPRTRYYAKLFFAESDLVGMEGVIEIRKKRAVTMYGWGCESAYKTLFALPLPD